MTERERFLAFASFQPVDRVPRRASYTPSLHEKMTAFLGGADPYTYFDQDTGLGSDLRPPDGFAFPDFTVYHPDREVGKDGFTIDAIGCGHLSHGFYHFTEYFSPLRHTDDPDEIAAFPIVSNEGWLDDRMAAVAAEARAAGRHTVALIGHIYENSWQVRGYEPFLVDLMTQRDVAELILDKFCQNRIRTATAAARLGYDVLHCGDDVANQQTLMFSRDTWRAVMKPRWARVWAAARAIKPDIQIWYHSDGNIWDILDDLVEIGMTILNPVQPECMDPLAIRRRFGKRLAFDGCVGTQTTFPFGTVDDMRRTVRGLATALDARNGGLMLSPTHVLEPEVPPENIMAFFQTCDEL